MNKEYLTQEKYESLKTELHNLKTVKRKEIAEHLEYARSLGDLSENAEYHDARLQQAEVESRIEQLEDIIKNAEIIKPHHSESVEVGSTVTIQKIKTQEKIVYQIVGSVESDINQNKISHISPLGSAMIGKNKGDEFSFKTPKGNVDYKIIDLK